MPGFGFSTFGSYSFGSTSGLSKGYSLGTFQFSVKAKNEGNSLKIQFYVPTVSDAPSWSRWIKILRKQGEYPQSYNDPNAKVSVVGLFPTEGWQNYEDTDTTPGVIYYYSLYELRTDGYWVHDTLEGRQWAYPYKRWGFNEYLFKSMPRGIQTDDSDSGHLQGFINIFGSILDAYKTDIEQFSSFYDIDTIHIDLLPFIDKKIGWPTYYAAGGIQKRKETKQAVALYKLLGTKNGYEAMLEEVAAWNCEVYEGWKHIMFSNGVYGSTTPDTTDPNLLIYKGTINDRLKYTNHLENWQSMSGLLFKLYEIPGTSDELTAPMIYRLIELIEWGKATFVNYGLVVSPLVNENVDAVVDYFLSDEITYSETETVSIEELGWETSDWDLFISNDPTILTNSLVTRTFHHDIVYS